MGLLLGRLADDVAVWLVTDALATGRPATTPDGS